MPLGSGSWMPEVLRGFHRVLRASRPHSEVVHCVLLPNNHLHRNRTFLRKDTGGRTSPAAPHLREAKWAHISAKRARFQYNQPEFDPHEILELPVGAGQLGRIQRSYGLTPVRKMLRKPTGNDPVQQRRDGPAPVGHGDLDQDQPAGEGGIGHPNAIAT